MCILKGGIAFFDSGIGGLTVLAECRKRIGTHFYYYGDNAHAPYGNLSENKIREYALEAFRIFSSLEVKAAVIACNTVTAVCIEELRKKFPFPVIGAEPAILPAARRGGEIFVLTTRATHDSQRFLSLCKKVALHFPEADIKPYACDGLAGAIEKNIRDPMFDYTPYLPKGNPNAVVLGCTHYIFIRKQIEQYYRCKIFDGNTGIAKRTTALIGTPMGTETDKIFFLGSGKNINRTQYEQTFTKKY